MKTRRISRILYVVVALMMMLMILGLFGIKSTGSKRDYFNDSIMECKANYEMQLKETLVKMHIPNAGVNVTMQTENGVSYEITAEIFTGSLYGDEESVLKALSQINPDKENVVSTVLLN